MHEKAKRVSSVIAEIIDDCEGESSVTVEEFLGRMGHRAIALAILVFSLSAVVAGVVPGFSTLAALPIMFMSLQMMIGRSTIYLPKKIRQRELSPKVISGALARSIPSLKRIEKFMRPRLTWLTNHYAEKFIALIIFILAGVLALPIPGGNFLPSFTISLLALSLIERDGILLLLTVLTLFFTGTLMLELIIQAWQYAGALADELI